MNFQAPAGGAISPVNNQFYEGGQFIPDTGLYCGLGKKARRHRHIDRNWSDIVITQTLFVYARYAGSGYEKYLVKSPFGSIEEASAFVAEVLKIRGEEYRRQGAVAPPYSNFKTVKGKSND